jgi:hypothetical protein
MSANWTYIRNGFYIVRTQAGFRQAVKHYWNDDSEGFPEISGRPGKYPMILCLTTGYRGIDYVNVRGLPVNDMLKAIAEDKAANAEHEGIAMLEAVQQDIDAECLVATIIAEAAGDAAAMIADCGLDSLCHKTTKKGWTVEVNAYPSEEQAGAGGAS